MENEETEDLLLEVTESEEEVYKKEEIDYYIEQRILDFIQNEKQYNKSSKKTFLFIAMCFFIFLSSSVLLVTLPVYIKYSSVVKISTCSKLISLSFINAVFFLIARVIAYLLKCKKSTFLQHNLCLSHVIKVSFLFSVGSISVFWLIDKDYISCHLKDPLKGCSIAFSLLFYFVFSRKKMSLEKTFCAITVIVGVFVSVDFGICDKFRCNGNSIINETTSKLHILYVVLYVLAHGLWVLHFTYIEVCWTTNKGINSDNSDSIFPKLSSTGNSGIEILKPTIQSLSIICQEEEQEISLKKDFASKTKSKLISSKCNDNNHDMDNSLNITVPFLNQLSVPDFNKFPLTSTPNNEIHINHKKSWKSGYFFHIYLWQHITLSLVALSLCWLLTISNFSDGKSILLVDVISEVVSSFRYHTGLGVDKNCTYLPLITIVLSISYVVLMMCSIEVLKTTQSAVTVVSVMMSALPMGSLFWSIFKINEDSINILEFNPEITGEAICAILGFPIIGIGIVLLLKSHIREYSL